MMEKRLGKPRTGHLRNSKVKILTNLSFVFSVRDQQASSSGSMVNITASYPQVNETSTSDFHQTTSPRTATFDARNGPVAPTSGRWTRALVVTKEGTGANTTRNPDTETKVEGTKIDNEFSNLSEDYNIQEFELEKGNNYLSIKGRLKKNLIFWQETLSASSAILEIIDNGYKIPFFKTTKRASFRNNESALKNKDFVQEPIFELLKCGSIIVAENLSEVINPLSVSINSSSKKRVILNLRYVNTHVYKDKIKFEDW